MKEVQQWREVNTGGDNEEQTGRNINDKIRKNILTLRSQITIMKTPLKMMTKSTAVWSISQNLQ